MFNLDLGEGNHLNALRCSLSSQNKKPLLSQVHMAVYLEIPVLLYPETGLRKKA